MVSKGERVRLAISLGIEIEKAIALFDEIEKMECDGISDARKARNKRYYDARVEELRSKARERKESLRRLKNPVSDGFKTDKTPKATETGKYLAIIGTPQHDAWNAYKIHTTGKSLPSSNKTNGWFVPAEWPPDHRAA